MVVAEPAYRRQVRSSHLVLSSLATWSLVVSVSVGEGWVAVEAVDWGSSFLAKPQDAVSSAHFPKPNDRLDCDGSLPPVAEETAAKVDAMGYYGVCATCPSLTLAPLVRQSLLGCQSDAAESSNGWTNPFRGVYVPEASSYNAASDIHPPPSDGFAVDSAACLRDA